MTSRRCPACHGDDVCPACGNCEGTVEHEGACDPGFEERHGRPRPWLVSGPEPMPDWLRAWHEHLGLA